MMENKPTYAELEEYVKVLEARVIEFLKPPPGTLADAMKAMKDRPDLEAKLHEAQEQTEALLSATETFLLEGFRHHEVQPDQIKALYELVRSVSEARGKNTNELESEFLRTFPSERELPEGVTDLATWKTDRNQVADEEAFERGEAFGFYKWQYDDDAIGFVEEEDAPIFFMFDRDRGFGVAMSHATTRKLIVGLQEALDSPHCPPDPEANPDPEIEKLRAEGRELAKILDAQLRPMRVVSPEDLETVSRGQAGEVEDEL